MGKHTEYQTVKHGLVPKEYKEVKVYFRPFPEKDEHFRIDFLYKGWFLPRVKATLFSITEGRNQRYYARVDLKRNLKPKSIQLDLPSTLVDKVLSHLEVYRQRTDYCNLRLEYDTTFFDDLADCVEGAVREKFGIPQPEDPKYPSKNNVIPFEEK